MRVYLTGKVPRGLRPSIRKMLTSSILPPDHTASIKFVSRRTITRANLRFRGINAPTDVLSFPYSAWELTRGNDDMHAYLGDMMICAEVVASDSQKLKAPFRRHLLRVVAHGVLHLLGYDHQTKRDEARMRRLESQLVNEALNS